MGSHCELKLFQPTTWLPAGGVLAIVRVPMRVAFRFVSKYPSTAGRVAADVICTILLAAVPTSTVRVPVLKIGPPSKPAPVATDVTVPEVPIVGSHCELVEFHAIDCPLAGTVAARFRPCSFTAFTLVIRNPSTAGICAVGVSCKILLAAVPTSTLRVPLEIILPATNPVPETTLTTEPTPADMGSHCELKLFQPTIWPFPGAVAGYERGLGVSLR